jgi:predicted GNAT family acetyltransferase
MAPRSNPATPTVIHQPEHQRFVVSVEGQDSVLEYRRQGGDRVDFHHTLVPEALRGRGIAEALVHAGFAWARGEGLQIEASCWYAARWLRRDPGVAGQR